MDQHADGCVPRPLHGPGDAKQDRPKDEHDPEAEAQMKGAVKKALHDPGAGAEHRFLAGLDEPTPPALLPDNIEGEEREP
jgi:hypothetical protein